MFAFSLLVVATLCTYCASRPIAWLLGVMPDDAFYYLKTARNIADTGLSTFDGIHPTNGYHPGWMAVLVLCAKLFHGSASLVRVAIAVGFAFHVATAYCLVHALKRWLAPGLAWAGGALWLANLVPVQLTLQAVEATFYVFTLALALRVYAQRFVGRDTQPSTTDFLALGLSLGLCFWGRTEAVVLIAVLILGLALSLRKARPWRALFVTGAASALAVTPWFLYSALATGTLFQRSGAMKRLWWAASGGAMTLREHLSYTIHYLLGTWASYPLVNAIEGDTGGWRGLINGALTCALAALAIRALRSKQARGLAALHIVLLAGTFATGAIYPLFFSDWQFWYKAQPSFVLFFVMFTCAAQLADGRWPRPARGLVWVILATMLGLLRGIPQQSTYPWQRDVAQSQQAFERGLPKDARIGCFNAGIPGYFTSRTVVNLDGLVNNSIYDYYLSHQVDRYLHDAQIAYIIDETAALKRAARFMTHPPKLTELAKAKLEGWETGVRYLWKVESRD